MLQTYSDNASRCASVFAGAIPSASDVQYERSQGYCRAWLEHTAFFVWTRRLSNSFEELKEWIRGQTSKKATDWQSLRECVVKLAVQLLYTNTDAKNQHDPAWLDDQIATLWWMYVAIVSECDYHLGTKF